MGTRRGNKISLTSSTEKSFNAKTLKQQDVETSNLQNAKGLKATLYFSPETTQRLDQAQVLLKQLTGQRGHTISRSAIVEAALKVALDEVETKKAESTLVALLLNS